MLFEKYTLPVLLLTALLPAAAGCTPLPAAGDWPDPDREVAWTVSTSVDVGAARHKERSELQDLKSQWDSTFVRPRLVADARGKTGFEACVELSGFWTDEEEETSRRDGAKISENEMDITGYEIRGLAGWGVTFDEVGRFSLLGGVAFRNVEVERKFSDGDSAKLDSDLLLAEVELRARLPIPRSMMLKVPAAFEARASWGWLLDPEVEAEGETVEGDRGWLLRLRAGFDVEINPRTSLYLGGFWEVLDITGGTKGAAEWPDSETKTGGGEIGLRFRF